MIVVGPALKAHLSDHPRLDPGRWRVQLRRLDERAGAFLQRLELRLHLLERPLVETGANVGGVVELCPRFGSVPVADENGAKRRARSLPLGVAADHEVRAPRGFYLQPRCGAAAGLVATVLALAHDAFEAAGERRGVQRNAIV